MFLKIDDLGYTLTGPYIYIYIYIYEIITFRNLLELIFQEIVKNEGANITDGNQRHNKYEKINKRKRLK